MAINKQQWERWKMENPDAAAARAAKIATAHKGMTLSDEHRLSISRAMAGKSLSADHRAAISKAMRSGPSKSNNRLIFALTLIAIALVLVLNINNIGFFTTSFEWTKWWEGREPIIVDSSTDWTVVHVDFGEHRTANCSDNIAVTTGDQTIGFEVLNEKYVDGQCTETEIGFKNIYFRPYFFAISFAPPTPANDSFVNNSWMIVNMTTAADATLALLELVGPNTTTMNVMAGMQHDWWYNATDLPEGDYAFRVYINDSYGNVNVSDTYIAHVNYSVPAGETVTEPPAYVSLPVESATYYIYYGRLSVNITSVEFVPPTPEDGVIITDDYAFVNATTDADANFALLEVDGPNANATNVMSGLERNWWYNLTDLIAGQYVFRVFVNDSMGNVVASADRTILVNISVPNITEPVNITEPTNITEPINFVPPTPDNDATITSDWTVINVSLELNATSVELEWNGANESMNGSAQHWWLNKTNLSEGVYKYRILVDNITSELRTLTVNYTWVPPSADIVPDVRDGFAYAGEKHRNKAYFENSVGKGRGVEFAIGNDSVTWQLRRLQWSEKRDNKEKVVGIAKTEKESDAETLTAIESATASIKGSKIKYRRMLSALDIEYDYGSDILKETIIIDNASALPKPKGIDNNATLDIVFKLDWSPGLDVIAKGGSWNGTDTVTSNVLFRKDGKFMFVFLPPYAFDAAGSSVNATYKLTQKGQNNFIAIQVPYDWLANATYPVTIDPTMSSTEWKVSEVVALGSGRSDSSGNNVNVTMVPGEPAIGQSATGLFTACLGFFCTGYDITNPVVGTPTFNVSNPGNKNTNVQVNATWSDNVAVDGCNYTVTGATSIGATAMTLYNSTSDYSQGTASAVVSSLNNGANTFTVNCRDTSGNVGTNSVVLTLDTSAPTITLVSPTPTNATTITKKWIYVNATVDGTGTDVDTCKLQWNGTNETMTKSGSGTSVVCYANKTSLSDGLYVFKVFASDIASNEIGTPTRTVTIDTKPKPQGTIVDDSTAEPPNKIDLIGNSTRLVWCNATFNDPDGANDLNVSWARVYGLGGSNTCTGDNNNCYYNSSCGWEAVNSTAKKASCTFNFWYNANPTLAWTCNITANDTTGYTGSGTDTVTVNSLLAIHVDDSIDFGTLAAGTNETYCAHNHTTWNYGNVRIDLKLNGTDLICQSPYANIPAGYLHYNCTNYNQLYATQSAALNSTPIGTYCTGFDLSKNSTSTTQDPIAPLNKTYWGVGVPTGTSGTCIGTIHITAVAG